MAMHTGWLLIDMSSFNLVLGKPDSIDADNCVLIEIILESKGNFYCLDCRAYVELLDSYNVVYRFTPDI